MSWSWLFGKKVEPLNFNHVKAAPPPSEAIEAERNVVGLKLQLAAVQTASLAGQLQETLAAGVLLELRGGRR